MICIAYGCDAPTTNDDRLCEVCAELVGLTAARAELAVYKHNAPGIAKACEEAAMKLEAARLRILELESKVEEQHDQLEAFRE